MHTTALALPDQRMYQAILTRDLASEGLFVFAVRTTGIFCRCTCPARRPLRHNVEFFATPQAALLAGYRACKRCRPLDTAEARRAASSSTLAARLKTLVDNHPTRRVRDADLTASGIDPSTARRQFQRAFGMTFQRYARAQRLGLALRDIRAGSPHPSPHTAAGFASPSGYRDAFAKLFGTTESRVRAGEPPRAIFARWIDTPIGAMLALADDTGLRLLDFVDRRGIERHIQTIRRVLNCPITPGDHATLDLVQHELEKYFAAKPSAFTTLSSSADLQPHVDGIPLAPVSPGGTIGGSPFQRSVWAELRSIPTGQTRSYAQQARAIGNPNAVRAVARANGENFLSLIIPCHRVIGADGSMTGYGGGVDRKRWLLTHETKFAP